MTVREKLELLFLHALPLDGTMWAELMAFAKFRLSMKSKIDLSPSASM
jgi:hypothetical protein